MPEISLLRPQAKPRKQVALPCRTDPDAWFSEAEEVKDECKEACRRCPARLACLKEGIDVEFGIWGGLDPEERADLKIQDAG